MLKSGSVLIRPSYRKPMSLIDPSVCAKIGSTVSADASAPTRNCPPSTGFPAGAAADCVPAAAGVPELVPELVEEPVHAASATQSARATPGSACRIDFSSGFRQTDVAAAFGRIPVAPSARPHGPAANENMQALGIGRR